MNKTLTVDQNIDQKRDQKHTQESELTPTGSNLLDGRYAVFGYIVDNYNLLKDMKVGDRITKTTLLSGGDKLVQPSNN